MLNNPILGWALAALAVAIGYAQWGWQGVVLAVTMIVFWLLLQFSRALRVLRRAGAAPVGQVPNAVMLHAKLQRGQRLPQVLAVTKSLGTKVSDDPETFEWRDAGGDAVRIELRDGKVDRWTLLRAADPANETPAPS
ncbi:MAG: hypothetical protein KIT60_26230 [Burkholderiaceae bacterium]|nr:hypothetical protein [Burkholderiaceae bacterium]